MTSGQTKDTAKLFPDIVLLFITLFLAYFEEHNTFHVYMVCTVWDDHLLAATLIE